MGLLARLFGRNRPAQAVGYVVLDVETTGLSPREDRILEIALVRLSLSGAPIDQWARRVESPLVGRVSRVSLADMVEEGAVGSLAYLETLLAALEDGELSAAESQQLAALSYAYEFTEVELSTIHRAFILALAHRALDDGHVSRDERAELHQVASALGVPRDVVVSVIARADSARSTRLGAGLRPLPADWGSGEPLGVGDKVVFTGCDDTQRTLLEERTESLGVRVVGSVSSQTAMLVTDGRFQGTKAAKAAELSTRVVHPDLFELLLANLQPALMIADPGVSAKPATSKARTAVWSSQRGARGASPSAVRAWAIANGIEVGARGRLHVEVFDAYWTAQVTESGE